MRKLIIFLVLMISSIFSNPITPELLTLLENLQIQHDGSLGSIVQATQKAWLRPPGKERWEIEKVYSEKEREFTVNYYQKTGQFDTRWPSKKRYATLIICGSRVDGMRERLEFAALCAEKGIEFEEVVLLTGARPLDQRAEPIPDGCKTEGEAMKVLWKQSPLFGKCPWRHLDHPMIETQKGSFRRPNTQDTFQLWLKTQPTKGPTLLISSQPFCTYFEAQATLGLPASLNIEVAGPSEEPDSISTAVLLDNLARTLYTHSSLK